MNKNRLFIIVLILIAFSGHITSAVQNPSVANPAGVTTTPQSYLRSNLVDTSSPIDNSGNQIVTGNVRRGAHFRGDVPYSSTSSFNSSLGSSTLSSFMRDSAGSEDFSSYRGSTAGSTSGTSYQPYYLPSSTVTTMSPNNSGLSSQLNTSVNNGSQYVSGSQTLQSYEMQTEDQPAVSTWGTPAQTPTLWQLYNSGLAGAQSQYNTPSEPQPVYRNPRVNEQLPPEQNTNQNNWSNPSLSENNTAKQSELPQYNIQQSPDQTNQWQQSRQGHLTAESTVPSYGTPERDSMVTTNQPVTTYTQRRIPTMNESATQGMQNPPATYRSGNLEQSLSANNTMYQPYTATLPANAQQYQEQRIPNAAQDTKTSEAIAQIQKQLDDLIRSIDSRLQNPADYTSQYTTTVQDATVPYQTDTSYQRGPSSGDYSVQNKNRRLQELMGTYDDSQMQTPSETTRSLPQNYRSQPAPASSDASRGGEPSILDQMTPEQIHTEAKRIMGPFTDYESYSQAKYNQIFHAAEGHLSIGRFYQAADAYNLAAIYNPDDPLCYAGRGHALFAAGEYVNSALLLIRAIEIDPDYVNTQIDLVELLGSSEDLDKRITELNKWLQKSNAPGLGFLLGYVYYRQGRLSDARKVMDVVSREMPQSRAAIALKMAIDFKLQTQK
jgi:tetratricopeptide (TPR) repeat protein